MSADTAHATFWDKNAEKYAARPVGNPAAFERKIAVTKSQMSPQSVVLDIGCGTGSLALRLADSGAHVHGLDVSSEMIRIANDKAATQGVDNVTFHVGAFDERCTAFEDASLDGICAYSLLHLVEDRTAALARIHRLLKPGGFFVSSTVCLGKRRVLFGPMLWLMRQLGRAPRVELFTPQTLVDEVRAAGFVGLSQPDVGAESIIAFIVARKPDAQLA